MKRWFSGTLLVKVKEGQDFLSAVLNWVGETYGAGLYS